MLIIKRPQSSRAVGSKTRYINPVFLIPMTLLLIFSASLVLPIGIQREITEMYFSAVKLVRESIFTTAGTIIATAKKPTLEHEKFFLNIKQKQLYGLEHDRKLAVSMGGGHSINFTNFPASIGDYDGTKKVKIRLKGDNIDQFEPNKQSFRIKMRGNEKFKGMSVFSAHHARHRNWLYEWLYLEILRREDIIAPRYYFGDLILNGKNLGLYALEEHFSTEMIEYNKRREGPIIRLDENLDAEFLRIISTLDNISSLPVSMQWPHYLTKYANTNSFSMIRSIKVDQASAAYRNCAAKFREYLDGKAEFSKIFDSEKIAAHTAISLVFGATHGLDINNQRFYCNSVTGKLEPIGYDGNAGARILSPKEILVRLETAVGASPDDEYLSHLVRALFKYTDPIFIEGLMADESFVSNMESNLLRVLRGLTISGREEIITYRDHLRALDNDDIFGNATFQHNSTLIRGFLNASGSIIATIKGTGKNKLRVLIKNIHPLPIDIESILFDGTDILQNKLSLGGLNLLSRDTIGENNQQTLSFELPELSGLKGFVDETSNDRTTLTDRLKIKYRILGAPGNQTFVRERSIVEKELDFKFSFQNYRDIRDLNIQNININEREKTIQHNGTVTLSENVRIPHGYVYKINPGSRVILNNNAFIFSESPFLALGTETEPILIGSDDGTGAGLMVVGTGEQSQFHHVEFNGLGNILSENTNGLLITSAATFYETRVLFKDVLFSNNTDGDDLLNIFRSEFVINNSKFHNSKSDALDIDFSRGVIQKTSFSNCGVVLALNKNQQPTTANVQNGNGDCIDLSGSNVAMNGLLIEGAGDKGISVGEASEAQASDITIRNVHYGVVSKDQSTVVIEQLSLQNAKIGLSSYQKKKEYGPGSIIAKTTSALSVDMISLAEKGSIIEATDIDGEIIITSYSKDPFISE